MNEEQFRFAVRFVLIGVLILVGVAMGRSCRAEEPAPVDTVGFFVDTTVIPVDWKYEWDFNRSGMKYIPSRYDTLYDTTWVLPVLERNHIYWNPDEQTARIKDTVLYIPRKRVK